MKHIALFLLILLVASSAVATPRATTNTTRGSFETEIKWKAGDGEDTEMIPRGSTCSVSVPVIGGSDVVALYQVPTGATAAQSGTLVKSFSAASTESFPFSPGQGALKAVATTATTGGSVMLISCSNSQISLMINEDGTFPANQTLTECIPLMAASATLPASGAPARSVVNGTNIDYSVLAFDDGADERAYWAFELPDNIAGTTATVEPTWIALACAAASADIGCWQFNGGGFKDSDVFKTGALSGTATGGQSNCATALDIEKGPKIAWTHGFDVTPGSKDRFAIFTMNRDEDMGDGECTSAEGVEVVGDIELLGVSLCVEVDNSSSGEDSRGTVVPSEWNVMAWDSGEWG